MVMGEEMSLPAAIAICRKAESSFYLCYCDHDWKPITDTWHQSLEDAKRQGEFEFTGVKHTWRRSAQSRS
jgi:hypothetical protein